MEGQRPKHHRKIPSTFEQRNIVASLCDDPFSSSSLKLRAKIILLSLQGLQSKSIARHLGINVLTVRKWRVRFTEMGVAGLNDSVRRRNPRVSLAQS